MRTESDIDLFIGLFDETDDVLAHTRVAELARKVSIWTGNDARPLVYRASEIAPAPKSNERQLQIAPQAVAHLPKTCPGPGTVGYYWDMAATVTAFPVQSDRP